jgi:hypothetical protein
MAFKPTEKKLLYSRFHQQKHRAANKGYLFAWESFEQFLTAVEKVAGGLPPEQFRVVYDMEKVEELGFCEETMSVDPYDEWNKTSRNQAAVLTASINHLMMTSVAAHLSVLLMTEDAEIDILTHEATLLASNSR